MEKLRLGVDFVIVPISEATQLRSLRVTGEDHQPLKMFFRKSALTQHMTNVARTFVAVPKGQHDGDVLGYITLVASEVARIDGQLRDCEDAHRYPTWPAVKIARMCTDDRLRGRDVGSSLMAYAHALVVDQVMPVIGCRFLVTDAKNGAISFYERLGFTLVDTDENRAKRYPVMFIDLLDPEQE